jgi:benzodiazapine receptor
MNRTTLRQIVTIFAYFTTLAFNTLTQLPTSNFGVGNNAEIANRYPDLYYFPANRAFSIWGLIYIALFAFVVYQALPSQKNNPHIERVGWLFIVTCFFNCAWITCFQYEQFALSMVMMLGLLATLITIYLRLGIGKTAVELRDKLLVHVPFSIYLGWITAATVTNAAYLLRDAGWDGFGIAPEVWAVIMLVITGVLGLAMIVRNRDIAYALVIAWATFWIYSRHSDVQLVAISALGVAVVMIIALVLRLTINRPSNPMPLPSAA